MSFIRNADGGRSEAVAKLELEKASLDTIKGGFENSTSKIALQFGVCSKTIWKVLERNLVYLYHIPHVQAVLLRDSQLRLTFFQVADSYDGKQ